MPSSALGSGVFWKNVGKVEHLTKSKPWRTGEGDNSVYK